MQPQSILRKPNAPSKGLHVRFQLPETPIVAEPQRKRRRLLSDGEQHPRANDQQWKEERAATMTAALTLLELSRSGGPFPSTSTLPTRSVQREGRPKVSMDNCPGLTPIGPRSTRNLTWGAQAGMAEESSAEAGKEDSEMTEPNSEPKAASGPKRFVIKYAEQSSED
jgi:hypothetical protein